MERRAATAARRPHRRKREHHETRHLPLSRAEDARRSGRGAGEVAPDDGRVLAGGQSLVPIMAFRLAKPTHLVDINGIKELAQIRSPTASWIGACVGTRPSTSRCATGRWASCSRRSCAASPTIRSAPAAPSAAAWRTPTRRPSGARSLPRSTPRWWRRAIAASAHRRQGLLRRDHDDGAKRMNSYRGAAAAAFRRVRIGWCAMLRTTVASNLPNGPSHTGS